jgi:hypothetical protein
MQRDQRQLLGWKAQTTTAQQIIDGTLEIVSLLFASVECLWIPPVFSIFSDVVLEPYVTSIGGTEYFHLLLSLVPLM